jgi:hypothetical protein
MNVFDNVSGGIKLFFIGNNPFYNISLDLFDILNIRDEFSISNFFRVDASCILSAQNVDKDLVFDKVEVV